MTLARRLSHVWWLGGSPCAGKSTIPDRLAAACNARVYRCDDAFAIHALQCNPERHPVFTRIANSSADAIWLRPVPQQIEESLELYREEFPMVLADLLAVPTDRPVIAEGAALLPELLTPLGLDQRRMLWMIPTELFQRHHYARRDWRHHVLGACSNPALGWENWMQRDAGFAREIERQALRWALRRIIVDETRSLDTTYAAVTRCLHIPAEP